MQRGIRSASCSPTPIRSLSTAASLPQFFFVSSLHPPLSAAPHTRATRPLAAHTVAVTSALARTRPHLHFPRSSSVAMSRAKKSKLKKPLEDKDKFVININKTDMGEDVSHRAAQVGTRM